MLLFVIAFVGGALTILSPCILPVLPFVFARAGQPFIRSGLPLLAGMATTFVAVASLVTVGGGWAVAANQAGRIAAMAVLALFGLALLLPALAAYLSRPLVAAGNRLAQSAGEARGIASSALLGVATGLLWAPCAGPILGLVLTGALVAGGAGRTTLLLAAYAAGAAASLAIVLLAGANVFALLKRNLGAGEWLRRLLGAAVLAGVAAIALGLDTGALTRLSLARTTDLEQSLIDRFAPATDGGAGNSMMMMAKAGPDSLPVESVLPSLSGATAWLNSPPLTPEALRGKVVLIDFWTYSCINCLRTLPYVRRWAERYKDHGLVVIGVHTPEFAFEKDEDNVKRALHDLGVTYPVALDNGYAIWRAFDNHYWPAQYFVDAEGRIRDHHFGEGDDARSETVIRSLLTEAGYRDLPDMAGAVEASGVGVAANEAQLASPETYVGYQRAANFASDGGERRDVTFHYAAPAQLDRNQWGLDGAWTVGGERAVLDAAPGAIVFHFRARDLHLVLGPAADGKPVRFRVTLDGAPPGPNHGVDTDEAGVGIVHGQRLYQLIRQQGRVSDRDFAIEFLDPGVAAYAFTFG